MIIDWKDIQDSHIGTQIQIAGFAHSIRDHDGLIFIDMRAESELLQCVIDPAQGADLFATAQKVHSEYVLEIKGTLKKRDESVINDQILTGTFELIVEDLIIVSESKVLPFDIHGENQLAGEDIRLTYRYLDFRRTKLRNLLMSKHKFVLDIRNWFDRQGFIDIATPILANSSPEGARDFLVPSRLHPGTFYALPQAPQQFKQLLMVGGFSKYYQIAPCFRDEDPRADRHPGDFYQIDAEIAWADQESIFELNERFVRDLIPQHTSKTVLDFARITYDDALFYYGSDKPDMRNPLKWVDAKDAFRDTAFAAFASLCDSPQSAVQALVIKQAVDSFSRKDLDEIQNIGKNFKLPGVAYVQYGNEGAKSPIFKFLAENEADILSKQQKLLSILEVEQGDLVFFLAHEDKNAINKAKDAIRTHVARKLDLIDSTVLSFTWVYDFPFFEFGDDGEIDFGHNPFSMPQGGLDAVEAAVANNTLAELKAYQYDLTLNGYEVLSGGVRNPHPQLLMRLFNIVGYSEERVRSQFKHMLEAYEFGAPRHAGFAWGLDRLFMVMNDESNIREVIAFPKNGSGVDVMTNSPSVAQPAQLKELAIKTLV